MSETAAARVPALLAERFATTCANFVAGLEWALGAAPHHPGFIGQAALRSIEQRALPLLKARLAEVDAAMQAYGTGEQGGLLEAARKTQTLSRDLDGFDLNINRTGDFLHEELTFVVMAAYQVLAAAGAA